MRIFPKDMNGVLNSVVNRQPMKKSPKPLRKNWGVRPLKWRAHVRHDNHVGTQPSAPLTKVMGRKTKSSDK